jgi:hypothetical protein
MGQTANSIHIYIRKGGYEPGFSLHVNSAVTSALGGWTPIEAETRALIPSDCKVQRVELQDPLGNVLDEYSIGLFGTWDGYWIDFRQCTRVTWISAGEKKPSGCFIHPLPYNAYALADPTTAWNIEINNWADAIKAGNYTDSEGFDITGMKRHYPSRRPNPRLAP